MPAMVEARKLGARAAKVGFDWSAADDIFAKLEEEIAELRAEMRKEPKDGNSEAIEEELGDLIFTVVNLARHLKVDPEFSLRRANAKFRRRFIAMEHEARGGEGLADLGPEELEALWRQAKLSSEESKQENHKL
jgi:XTP/dITP diphosphohydrolase/ATP diphosphatase